MIREKMLLYGRKLVNYIILFDSQLNVEFNAVKIKNIPNKPKIDV